MRRRFRRGWRHSCGTAQLSSLYRLINDLWQQKDKAVQKIAQEHLGLQALLRDPILITGLAS